MAGSLDAKPNERIFFWVDSDGVRCSPRHSKVSSALEFYKNPRERWIRGENGRPKLIDVDPSMFPSQGVPVRLKVAEWVERELTDDERKKVEQLGLLKAEGLA
jgi:hypothetical protein